MTRLQLFTILLPLLFMNMTFAQDNLNYQEPPEEILQLVDVELAPSVAMDNKGEYMLFLYRNAYKSIEELSQKEMRLGGLRIDPARNVGSRTTFFNNLKIKKMQEEGAEPVQVSGLPKDLKLTGLTWSPNEKYGAFLHRAETGVELWFVEMATAKAQRLTGPKVNANMR
ncbi:MAG: S9 family peptidase, partial [Bacteroidota bacterium]